MININLISIIVGIFIGLGAMIAGIGYAYAQFKSGGDKAKDDLIKTLKDTADAEKAEKERLTQEKTELITSHQQQLTQLNKDLSELKGRFDEQTKRANEYKEILQGKDPRQIEYMDTMSKGLTAALKYINESDPVIKKLDKFLDKQK